jgi:hypothetical protein
LPEAQEPPEQTSPKVQASLSLQSELLLVVVQPLAGSQPSSVHAFPSLQLLAGPALQVPFSQADEIVHALASSQLAVLFE